MARFAVVAALVIGALIAAASGDVASAAVPLAFVTRRNGSPCSLLPALWLSVGLPFFLVTMALAERSGVRHPAGIGLYRTGLLH
ncbi:benzoate/H(+) symporter BenE family transporter [Klebsiella pneumoniae subsp. pneumoniae]|nr:benzoate/H(+) symporter BenE family transporter [Klebsiella pneumoniae subsp. pneumoniae]